MPLLVEFLKMDTDTTLQYEASRAITSITAGSSEHVKAVVESDGIAVMLQLLKSSSSPSSDFSFREEVILALGNIAGDSLQFRDLALKSGAMQTILSQLAVCNPTLARTITCSVLNLLRGKPKPCGSLIAPALPELAQLFYSSADEEVQVNVLWALSYCAATGDISGIDAVVNCQVLQTVVGVVMRSSKQALKSAALRLFGNIFSGNDVHVQALINAGVLPCLLDLLSDSSNKCIVSEACWVVSVITCGTRLQIQAVIDANIIAKVIELFDESNLEIQSSALSEYRRGSLGRLGDGAG